MKSACISEITATAKRLAFSKKVIEEDFYHIAALFTTVSVAESFHANNHKSVIEVAGAEVYVIRPNYKVKLTIDNLADNLNGEFYEATELYLGFLKTAKKLENYVASVSTTFVMKINYLVAELNTFSVNEILQELKVDVTMGLSQTEVGNRTAEFGTITLLVANAKEKRTSFDEKISVLNKSTYRLNWA